MSFFGTVRSLHWEAERVNLSVNNTTRIVWYREGGPFEGLLWWIDCLWSCFMKKTLKTPDEVQRVFLLTQTTSIKTNAFFVNSFERTRFPGQLLREAFWSPYKDSSLWWDGSFIVVIAKAIFNQLAKKTISSINSKEWQQSTLTPSFWAEYPAARKGHFEPRHLRPKHPVQPLECRSRLFDCCFSFLLTHRNKKRRRSGPHAALALQSRPGPAR